MQLTTQAMCRLNIHTLDTSGGLVNRFTLNSGEDSAIRNLTVYHQIKTGGSQVLRGTLSQDGSESKEAVAKLAREDLSIIRCEASFYSERLARLQGLYVPCFYGYYEGKVPTSEGQPEVDVGCLVLEYCGRKASTQRYQDQVSGPHLQSCNCSDISQRASDQGVT